MIMIFQESKVPWLILTTTILITLGSLFFVLKSNVEYKDTLSDSASTVVALKQEIVYLKLQKVSRAVDKQKIYKTGLAAELKGDRAFIEKKYALTKAAYMEAILNFKSVIDKSNDADASSAFIPKPEKNPAIEDEIKFKIKEIYEQAIYKELARLAIEQPHNKSENVFEKVNYSDASSAFNIELEKEAVWEGNVKQKLNLSKLDALPPVDYKTAQGEIQNLIKRYQESFNNRNIEGFKALFYDLFSEEDEKRWSDFFKKNKNWQVTVLTEQVQINNTGATVILAVFIESSRHEDSKPTRRGFVEVWKLEQKNKKWIVALREINA